MGMESEVMSYERTKKENGKVERKGNGDDELL